jgi:transcriptional regulator with XRE-family HTH domain
MNAELKAILKKKGIKQKDIAEAVGKSKCVVSEYFNGQKNMSQDTADKISELIGVPIEDYIHNIKKINKRGHSARVMAYELREGLMGVDSNAHGLHYLLDKGTCTSSRKLTILVIYQGEEMSIKLDRKMAKALIEEIKDICEMQWEGYI